MKRNLFISACNIIQLYWESLVLPRSAHAENQAEDKWQGIYHTEYLDLFDFEAI